MSHRLRCAHRDRSKCLADVFCCGAFLISHEPENKNLSRPTTTIDAIKWNYTQRSIHIPSGLQQRSPRSHEHWSRIFHTKKKLSFFHIFISLAHETTHETRWQGSSVVRKQSKKKKWFSCKMMFSHAKSDSEMLSERCGNKTVLFSIFDYKCRDAQQSLITKAWFACSDNRRTSISLYRSQAAFSMASIFTAIYFCLLIILLNNKMQVEQWIGVTYRARDSYCWTQERRVQ